MPSRTHPRGPSLPPLVSSFPTAAQALVTLSTATAPSPSSTQTLNSPSATPMANSMPKRTGSKRLERVRELLSPIRRSPVSAIPTPVVEEEEARAGTRTRSGIDFFERHPLDSRNPLTFLGGGCGSGGGVGPGVDYEKKDADGKGIGEAEKVCPSSSSSFWTDLPASPPRDIPGANARVLEGGVEDEHDPLAGFERLDLRPQAAASPITRNNLLRRARSQADREVLPIRARPAALYELPGRFRSVETCWHCATGEVGKRCRVCGLVVRRNSEEKY
ncbi:MAG: hypothetical protein Q9170_006426 [Blastenia crenularia]